MMSQSWKVKPRSGEQVGFLVMNGGCTFQLWDIIFSWGSSDQYVLEKRLTICQQRPNKHEVYYHYTHTWANSWRSNELLPSASIACVCTWRHREVVIETRAMDTWTHTDIETYSITMYVCVYVCVYEKCFLQHQHVCMCVCMCVCTCLRHQN